MLALVALVAFQSAAIAYLLIAQRGHAQLIAEVVRCASPDLCEMVALVDRLCQRVQAPQAAVAEHAAGVFSAPQHVPMDDDSAYHQSKEELADLLEAARVGS